jgi:hypothetical protein
MALVVFLRAGNVGGHNKFRPSILAKELSEYDVVNIGAAGTFVVRKAVSQEKFRRELLNRLGFSTEVMMCEGRVVANFAADDPLRASLHVRTLCVLSACYRKLWPSSLPSLGNFLPTANGS